MIVSVVAALSFVVPAHADIELPTAARLAIEMPEAEHGSTQLLPLRQLELAQASGAAPSTPTPTPAPLVRVSSLDDEPRAFWFAAGASAIASLGTRVLLVIPTWLIVFAAIASGVPVLGHVAGFALALGALAAFVIADSAVAAVASSMVYDNTSRFYETSFLAGFAGQLAGNSLATGVTALTMGFGAMVIFGFEALAPFTAANVAAPLIIFSTLGVMPAFVVAFLASVALPALIGVWALSVTARPKEGFAIDPTWRPVSRGDVGVVPDLRKLPLRPLVSVVIPGT